ncbi:MAG: DUF72 domain-containing protein [Bacteroidota bacterium]
MGVSGREIDVFCEVIAELGPRLGCCFIQLHPAFSPEDLSVLEKFLQRFPAWIPLAVEVRHPDFFSGGYYAEKYFSLLRNRGISAVITDVAGRRDVCHATHRFHRTDSLCGQRSAPVRLHTGARMVGTTQTLDG